MSPFHIEAIFPLLLVVLQCIYVYSGSFTGRQLTEHIKYYEEINYNIDDINRQHLRVARSPSHRQSSVDIKFYSHDRYFHLRLRRDTSIFMQDFALITSEGEIPYTVDNTYVGEIVDEPGSHCHGTITNGTLSGRVYAKEDSYTLEPAKLYFDSTAFHSVMYADKHVNKDGLMGSGCGVVGEIQKRMQEKLDRAQQKMKDESMEEEESPKEEGKSRQRRQTIDQQTCALYIQTDHVFYQKFGSREAVVSYVAGHIQAADFIYSTTNFDTFRDINFAISRLRVWTVDDKTNTDYKFSQDFIGVEKYLDLASEGDQSQYCAAFTFTDRDFSNGVLGLAWIASTGAGDGGICSKYSRAQTGATLNSGIVTLNNYGSFVPPTVSHLTFAHELGHSFGSGHDPATLECTPGGDQGNFLMFSHASSGDKPNNNDFSLCSIGAITDVLNSKYNAPSSEERWCFVQRSAVTNCGNDIVEEGEECDCGYEDTCDDQCCHAQTEDNSNANACMLKDGKNCSPSQGACCDADTCEFKSSNDVCRAQGECNGAAMCTGSDAICPMPAARRDGETCNDGKLLCDSGSCNQSICTLADNLEQCQCSGERAALCQVCCQNPNQPQTCVPSYRINIPNGVSVPTNMSVGSPCNNYMGYCDIFNECRLADEDGPLTSIIRRIFFSEEPEIIEAIKTWLEEMWWIVLICVLCILAVMIITVVICNRLVPTTNPFRHEKEKWNRERRASVRFRGRQDRSTTNGKPSSYESAL